MFKLFTWYDGKLEFTHQFADALEAFEAFASATYNLEMPNGKMYTKNFNQIGLVSAK